MANQAEVDLVVNATGALPDLERDLARIIREAENDADAIDVDVAIDTRDAVRTLSRQVGQAADAAEGQLDGIEVGVLIEQAEALRTLDRQLSEIIDITNRGGTVDDGILIQAVLDGPESLRNMRRELDRVVASVEATADDIEIDVDLDIDEPQLQRAERGLASLGRTAVTSARGVGVMSQSVLVLSAGVGGLVPLLASVTSALTQLAPAAAVATQAMLAQKLVAGTLKLAMNGVEDAVERAFDPELSPDEFHKSLKGLAPEAALFVDQLHTMRRELRGIQQGVQNRVFKDLDEVLSGLARETGPALTRALNSTATSLNNMAKGVAVAAVELRRGGVLDQALQGTTKGLENLEQVPARVTRSFGFLAAASAPAFDRITLKVAEVAEKIERELAESFTSGELEKAIDAAVSTIGQIFRIIGNFGAGVGNIFAGLTETGGGLFGTLEKISEAFEKLTASTEFQTILTELSLTFDALVGAVLPLVQEAFVQLAPVIEALAPVVRDFIAAIGPELIPVIQELGPILVDIALLLQEQLPLAIGITKSALELLSIVLIGVQKIMDNVVLPAARKVSEFLNSDFARSVRFLTDTVTVNLPQTSDAFRSWSFDVLGTIGSVAQALSAFAARLSGPIVEGVRSAVETIAQNFLNLPDRVIDSLASLINSMFSLGRNAAQGFVNGLASGIGSILATARSIADAVTSTISDALDINSPSKVTEELGKNTGDGYNKGLKSTVKQIQITANDIARQVAQAFQVSKFGPSFGATASAGNVNAFTNSPHTPALALQKQIFQTSPVVNVYLGNELVNQYVTDRVTRVLDRRDRTAFQGVRI